MKYLFISLAFLFSTVLTNPIQAQEADISARTLDITTTAKVMLPADLIQFNIVINAEAQQAQKAYTKHQELEQSLVSLLEQYDINKEDIKFEPISIRQYKDRTKNGTEKYYRTEQAVRVTFSDFKVYEQMQIALIEHGYDQFSGQFITSQKKEGLKQALKKAINKAQSTAKVMAETAGVQLGEIAHISHTKNVSHPYPAKRYAVSAQKSESLLQYEQMVTISATVSMEYLIQSR